MIEPEKIDNNNIRFLDQTISLKTIGCKLNASELLNEWKKWEGGGFPLKELSYFYFHTDTFLQKKFNISFPFPPYLRHLVNLIDLMHRIEKMDGAKKRIMELRDEFKSLVFNINEDKPNKIISAKEIHNRILSVYDEFLIGSLLYYVHPYIKFNEKKGPDFEINNLNIKIETKSKLNRRYIGEIIDRNNITRNIRQININTCLNLLSKDVFESGRIEEAFEKQGTDIAILNTTHSQFGPLFVAYAVMANNSKYGFEKSINAVLEKAKKKKMIVLCCEGIVFNEPFHVYTLAEEKEIVEDVGSKLDKIEKNKKIDTKTPDGFNQLINQATLLHDLKTS